MFENDGLGGVLVAPEFTIIRTSSADNNMTILGSELAYWPLHGSLLFYFLVMCVLFKQSRQISEGKKDEGRNVTKNSIVYVLNFNISKGQLLTPPEL